MAALTLQDLVARAASLHPGRVAATFTDGSASGTPVSLLYRDLTELADELSVILRRECCPNNGVIGLYCRDDLFIPVWILGILRCPAAYVPLDQQAPGLHSTKVMKQCGLKYCVVMTDVLEQFQRALDKHLSMVVCAKLPKFKLSLIELLPFSEHTAGPEQTRVQTAARPGDLAYVLHTSGTTGNPKIVRVPHKCILPNILHLKSLFQMRADDVVFLASPLTFDPSVVDMFLALATGAQLLIIPAVVKKVPSRLAQLLFSDHKATVLQVTPTLLVRFGERILKQEVLSANSSLRVLALGGEDCPSPALLRRWRHEDNKTHIYNIYGVTEVSCWACCYKIPESQLQPSNIAQGFVPLGTALLDTAVEVRDELGRIVTEGEGQVFIGGQDRVCLLDEEETVLPGTMRPTGDWVEVKDAQWRYLGRKDRQIKRHGQRVDLDSVQKEISALPGVEACAVALHRRSRMLAFVVASTSGDQRAASPLASVDQHSSSVERHQEEADLGGCILKLLSQRLQSYKVPDEVVPVSALGLTPHGKVDIEELLKTYEKERQRQRLDSLQRDVTKLKPKLWSLWQKTLLLPEDVPIDEKSNFLLSGGDSLKALQLHDSILLEMEMSSEELLEVILDGTFADLLHHLERAPLDKRPPESRKRGAGASSSAVSAKREHKESPGAEEMQQGIIVSPEKSPDSRSSALREEGSDQEAEGGAVRVSLSWSSDTGRCVDASPVLLVRGRSSTVLIGSHSHRIQALDLITGSLLWERVLGDRMEAAAAVSHCKSLVIVGCYDGCVYFLCAASGETRWVFRTENAVKSRPTVDPQTGVVIVGSRDGHVYALSPKAQQCVWKRHCGGGAVFSSPYLHASLRQLYVATLGGQLLCLDPDSGETLWSHHRDKPFFSSPDGSSDRVVIGSVDGNICCFSSMGEVLWEFLTKGPVFSSPRVTPDQRRVLCGSHDGCLYCLNLADGSLVWTFRTTGKVYSSPSVFAGSAAGGRALLAAVASTDGTLWILDSKDGQMLASFTLPGELFSSPVVRERLLVIGCRNDFVYCLKLEVKEES
ncbi:uncharacterized protein V6R79_012033 [Siganus canaliculatus]